jgi:hypothetical protein
MSEHTLYIRRTKGGHVMPPVSRDELLALIESKGVTGDDELKVVGTRTFPSDETWAPVRDYPEVSRFFGATGRAQVKVEVKKAQQSWRYAAGAVLLCMLAAIFFWWNPYVDAKDAAGEVVRLGAQGEVFKKESAEREERLGQAVAAGQRKIKALDEQVRKLREELGEKQAKLDETLRRAEIDDATASTLASSDKALRAEVSKLKARVEQLNDLPKFWPGAEAFDVPASADDVRLISTLPNNGYLYVIGTKSYPNGTHLELNQSGIFGTRVFARVVNSYPHAGGGQGMSLHVPDPQDDDVAKIRKLKLGDVLKCSVSSTEK